MTEGGIGKDVSRLHSMLIVDDDHEVTRALKRSFRTTFDVTIANCGRIAHEQLVAMNDVDLVVLDVTMPDYDSVELMLDLRASNCFPKIILISGWRKSVMESVAAFGLASGFDIVGTLQKPFTHTMLLELALEALKSNSVHTPTHV